MVEEVQQLDLTPEFPEEKAQEYAEDVVEQIAEGKDFDHVMDGQYVNRPGIFLRYLPGMTDYALGAEDTRIKYNQKYVEASEVEEALEDRIEQTRTEFTSWKALRDKLTE